MPKHRQLASSAPAARRLPTLADAERLAIPMLLVAVAAAIIAALVPAFRDALVAVSIAVAAPSAVLTLRREHRAAAEREWQAYARLEETGTDVLTGTGNPTSWNAALELAVLDAQATPLTVARITIDGPAADDDHESLDRLLIVAAVRWQEILRPGDTLARIAPTDFAVLLPRCDQRAAETVVARLREAVPDTACSIAGLATWNGEETPSQLVGRAVDALDRAKTRAAGDPFTDPARLAAVEATGLAIREPSEEFDAIAASVAWMLSTPIVLITLFDETWQHFIGEFGVEEHGGPRHGIAAEDAICRQTVITGQALVVSDTDRHPATNALSTTRAFGIAACASVPITTIDGHVLGSICAVMLERHPWSADDLSLLRLTARRVAERLAELPVAGYARTAL